MFSALEVNIALIIFEKAERTEFSSGHCDLPVTETEYFICFHRGDLRVHFLYRFVYLLTEVCTLYGDTHRIVISAVKLVALYNRTKYHFGIFSKVAVYSESVLCLTEMYPFRQFFRRCRAFL